MVPEDRELSDQIHPDAEPAANLAGPVVSVLLPTIHPWPEISASLDAILAQSGDPAFEVLVLDGHGGALAEAPRDPSVRWLRFPGLDGFALRSKGVAAARGTLIAINEDHCIAPLDWIASIAAAHRADTRAALVGTILNHPDSTRSAVDRANFVLTFAGQNAKRLRVSSDRLPVPTNLSFKRAALPANALEPCDLEYRWIAQLRDSQDLGVAPSVVLQHRQSWGIQTIGVHLASGRSYGAVVRAWPRKMRRQWLRSLPFLPMRLARLAMPDLLQGAGGKRPSLFDVICLLALILANVGGQLLGLIFGPGTSRARL